MKGLLFITHQNERFSYLQSVNIALEGGCRLIQLRMKTVTDSEVLQTAFKAKELCSSYGAQLFINDRVEVCKEAGTTGVHLGRYDMPPDRARLLLGTGFVTGGTANTFDDIVVLNRQGVDYIGLGPFRFTSTKTNLSSTLGISGYKSIIRKCRENSILLPIVAIGGITAADVRNIMNTGVTGIAVSSAILNAKNPVKEVSEIIKRIEECNTEIKQ